MKTYQYEIVSATPSQLNSAQKKLNELGKEGFRVIKIVATEYRFLWTLEREALGQTPYRG